jgi:hypothetical protein
LIIEGAHASHTEPGVEHLEQLHAKKNVRMNDSDVNASLRASFRKDRKRRNDEAKSRGWRPGSELLQHTAKDVQISQTMTFGDGQSLEMNKLQKIRASSIFQSKERRIRNDSSGRPDQIGSIPETPSSGVDSFQVPDRIPSLSTNCAAEKREGKSENNASQNTPSRGDGASKKRTVLISSLLTGSTSLKKCPQPQKTCNG